MAEEVICRRRDGIVTLSLNRPEEQNMLSDEVLDKINEQLLASERDGSVRVVILTGEGREFFCGGVFNPLQKAKLSPDQIRARRRRANELFERIENLLYPVIAAVNGRAQAGGFELALACDIRVAASHAAFALPETAWGGFPGAGAPIRLPHLVGTGKAMEIIMTGRDVQSKEALRIGLVEQVFPSRGFRSKVEILAASIAATAPLGNRAVKKLVRSGMKMDVQGAQAYSDALRELVGSSEDAREGMAAHLEGRPPKYKAK